MGAAITSGTKKGKAERLKNEKAPEEFSERLRCQLHRDLVVAVVVVIPAAAVIPIATVLITAVVSIVAVGTVPTVASIGGPLQMTFELADPDIEIARFIRIEAIARRVAKLAIETDCLRTQPASLVLPNASDRIDHVVDAPVEAARITITAIVAVIAVATAIILRRRRRCSEERCPSDSKTKNQLTHCSSPFERFASLLWANAHVRPLNARVISNSALPVAKRERRLA